MKSITQFLSSALFLLGAPTVIAAPSNFAGSNLYYAAGLTDDQQTYFLSGLQEAGVKVLRVWLDGQSGEPKATKINEYPGLEPSQGSFDDTVLERLDSFMMKSHDYGIKLMVSIHSYNALSGKSDYYGNNWPGDFYKNEDAKSAFKKRISHVLEHVNPNTNKKWSESSEYIFAFEAQNEAMHEQEDPDSLTTWQCEMAKAMKSGLSDGILTTTGGGSYLQNSLLDPYFQCAELDIVAAHAYGTGDFDTSKIQGYVQKAKDAGKFLIMQEWGACYFDSANEKCSKAGVLDQGTRDSNIKKWYQQIADAGVAPFYWQFLPQEQDPHQDWDYEIGIGGENWEAAKEASAAVNGTESAFDWSPYLL